MNPAAEYKMCTYELNNFMGLFTTDHTVCHLDCEGGKEVKSDAKY